MTNKITLSRESLTIAMRLATRELETLANGSAIERHKAALAEFRAALAEQPQADAPLPDYMQDVCDKFDWTPEEVLKFYAEGKHFDTAQGRTRILETGAVASYALKNIGGDYADMKGANLQGDAQPVGVVSYIGAGMVRVTVTGDTPNLNEPLYTHPAPAKVEPVPPAGENAAGQWRDGAPINPRDSEWFLAQTVGGEYVVLRPLPEEYTYDFTTADGTYLMGDRVKRWAQLSVSNYVEPTAVPPAGGCEVCKGTGVLPGLAVNVTKCSYCDNGWRTIAQTEAELRLADQKEITRLQAEVERLTDALDECDGDRHRLRDENGTLRASLRTEVEASDSWKGEAEALRAKLERMTTRKDYWYGVVTEQEDRLKSLYSKLAEKQTLADNYCALLMDANGKLAERDALLSAIAGWTKQTRDAVLESFQDELNESASYAWYDAAIADLMKLVAAISASAEPAKEMFDCNQGRLPCTCKPGAES